MPTLPQTRTKHLIPFSALVARSGRSVDRLLRQARLPSDCLSDPERLVPSDAAFRFRELVARQIGTPNAALVATEQLRIADLGDFGSSLLGLPTLSKVLSVFRDLSNTQSTMVKVELKEADCGGVAFCYHFEHPPKEMMWHSDLYVLQLTIKAVRLVAPSWSPSEIWISSPPGEGRRFAAERLGSRFAAFGCDSTGFVIPSSMLALPIANAETANGEIDYQRMRSTGPAETCSHALRQILLAYAGDRWLSIDQTAEVLDSSTRTLQRRLDAEGSTYSEIVSTVRAQRAADLLLSTDAKIIDIGRDLGYSSPGNFTRAFRRWAGVSPAMFRLHRLTR